MARVLVNYLVLQDVAAKEAITVSATFESENAEAIRIALKSGASVVAPNARHTIMTGNAYDENENYYTILADMTVEEEDENAAA